MARTRTTRAAIGHNSGAPQTLDEATAAVGRVGALRREIAYREADLAAKLTAIRQAAEAGIQLLRDETAEVERGVEAWATANREPLAEAHGRKTITLATGEVSWRDARPTVKVADEKGLARALANLAEDALVRLSPSLDKAALLRAVMEGRIRRAAVKNALVEFAVEIVEGGERFAIAPYAAPTPDQMTGSA